MKDQFYDAMLNIKTTGDQKGFNKSIHYHRYEPTPYEALKILFNEYELTGSDRIVDFGSGKGRLAFFVHYLFHASAVGVEMNETFYIEAVANLRAYLRKNKVPKDKILFSCCLAEEYQISPSDNRFYFFNPFTIQIYVKIINRILRSVEETPREVELILYYPPEDYIFYLENKTSFYLVKEVVLPGLYEQNHNERFLIYRLRW